MPFIDPTPDQIQALQQSDIDGPIHMLNLLKFKPEGGQEAYAKYGQNTMPLILERGGKVVYQSQGKLTVIGDETWDAIVIVEYPTRQAFFDMIASDQYQKGVHYRTQGLEDSRLICMQTG